METKITMKLVFGEDSKRILVDVNEMTYEGVKIMVKKFFAVDKAFYFHYEDEKGHSIDITSQTELCEAVRIACIHQNTLTLVVMKNEEPNPKIPFCPTPLRTLNHLDKLEECCKGFQVCGKFPLHCNFAVHSVCCRQCFVDNKSKENIKGTRYNCTYCKEFDLCNACYEKERTNPGSIHDKEHSEHFVAITHPGSKAGSRKRRWSGNRGAPISTTKDDSKDKPDTQAPSILQMDDSILTEKLKKIEEAKRQTKPNSILRESESPNPLRSLVAF